MDEKDNASLERGASNDITRYRWRLKIRENIIGRLVAENERLRTLATHATPSEGSVQNCCTLTDEEREAVLYFSGHYAGFYGLAMHGLAMRLGLYDLPRDTPDTHATPSEGSVQDRCTLTDEERAAIATAADLLIGSKPGAALRNLLARLS